MTVSAAPDARHRLLRRLALGCTCLMLATIGLSAFMRLSQAGIGCADWPACYGARLGEMPAGDRGVVAARLAHRVVAAAALLLVMLMLMLSVAQRPRLVREGRLSLALMVLALALAALGIVTPGARVPAVAMGNLLGGFAMLALCWRLASPATRPGLGRWAWAGLLLVALQVALGALVSASYSALSCSGLIDCSQVAQATGWDWRVLNPWRVPGVDAPLPLQRVGAPVPWAHRVLALAVLALLAALALQAWRRGRRAEGLALGALVVLQSLLGPLLVAADFPMALVLAHNLTAALLLAVLARLV
jgi:cytochrome c oxidase assembly protein subunit 15